MRDYLPARPRVLDLGCGTGRFAEPFARELQARVLGVEPSARMLAQATRHERVAYVRGRGERLPLPRASVNSAFLSMVLHHFSDLDAVFAELARVLVAGSRVVVRNSFGDRIGDEAFFRFFHEARAIDAARIPTVARVCRAFEGAGFAPCDARTVRQVIDESHGAYYRRMLSRPYSTFHFLSEPDIRRGFARLAEFAQREREPAPVVDNIHVMVFSRNSTDPHESDRRF